VEMMRFSWSKWNQ